MKLPDALAAVAAEMRELLADEMRWHFDKPLVTSWADRIEALAQPVAASGPAANPQGVDEAMVERAEDYYYDNSPFNGPDELREGIRQMLIAALAHKGNGE